MKVYLYRKNLETLVDALDDYLSLIESIRGVAKTDVEALDYPFQCSPSFYYRCKTLRNTFNNALQKEKEVKK